MRFLFGIVVGVALTVGVAFVTDNWGSDVTHSAGTQTSSAAPDHRAMVNWDVVGNNIRVVREHASAAWARLTEKLG